MSHCWLVVIMWVVLVNPVTGATIVVVVIIWVCLVKFHEWWEEDRPDIIEEIKEMGRQEWGLEEDEEVVVHDFYYFGSLLSVGANHHVPLVEPSLMPETPLEVLEEAESGVDLGRAGVFFEVDGQHLLRLEKHPWLKKLLEAARVGFEHSLWGGGARGSLAHLVLAAGMDENEGRPISGN
jgi:hypothetical protein